MTERALRLLVFSVALTVSAPLGGGRAQTPPGNTTPKPVVTPVDDFTTWTVEALIRERDALGQQVSDLNTRITWINDALSKRNERDQLVTQHKSTEQIDKDINTSLGYAGLPGIRLEELESRARQQQGLLEDKQNRRAAIDAELTRRADLERPKQTFKLQMSGVFALLVGIVIVGFFAVAFRDEQVRREIFSGQSGIQFVTLFSLVIAIILFGIIGVLEGKELAALLGGLSGYILGRTQPPQAPRTQPGPQPQPSPQPQLGPEPPPAPRPPGPLPPTESGVQSDK